MTGQVRTSWRFFEPGHPFHVCELAPGFGLQTKTRRRGRGAKENTLRWCRGIFPKEISHVIAHLLRSFRWKVGGAWPASGFQRDTVRPAVSRVDIRRTPSKILLPSSGS